jgi:hypothetical protein
LTIPGSAGSSGTSGGNGAPGTSGSSGSAGSSGVTGAPGTSGSSGSAGSSGVTGAPGTSGSSGTAGTSVSVSGTTNQIVKFTGATTIGNSNASDDGTTFLISTVKFKVATSMAVGAITPSATTGRIDAANDVVAFSTSDRNLKENFVRIEKALDKVRAISGYEFDWKAKYKIDHGFEGHDVGVIAQEIERVLPEVVTTKFNGWKGVKYDKIVPLLIEAIKELADKVEKLEKQNVK